MDIRLPSTFSRQTGDIHGQTGRLSETDDHEIADMVALQIAASEMPGISVADRLPDDSMTAVKAAVVAETATHPDPEALARMAWASNTLA